ncbi:nucleotidyltransferase family protein [Infirmifilum lucidum]|uniref:Nucleotidyltransferase family protein n=1 Tax=Infirmifilum lucidum TaxID=2776706 RepID=A0A7L9FHR8_9CREN|nr:nucleotidyltransferase family protein [Infirmifilum lucidum]QOJ79309.1 nucleotidyltransferase family protein [Infirmifilum lucidum]
MPKAVILAGGPGKRLKPLTDDRPKPLVEVGGRPIVAWQVEWLRRQGVSAFIVCVGYLKEKFLEVIGNGSRLGVKVYYSVEEEPLGTGGALKNAEPLLGGEEVFLVVNGDVLTDIEVSRLLEKARNAVGAIALVPLPSPYGVVETEGDVVTSFVEKPLLRGYWINAGVYAFTPRVFEYLPEKGDIEREAFPRIAREGFLRAVKYEGAAWKSVDTHKDIEEAERNVVPRLKAFLGES